MTPDAVPTAAMKRMVVGFGNRIRVISSKRVPPTIAPAVPLNCGEDVEEDSAAEALFDDEEPGLAAARGNVDDGRAGEAHHRALHAPAKEEGVRVHVHRPQVPRRLVEDGED